MLYILGLLREIVEYCGGTVVWGCMKADKLDVCVEGGRL